MGVSWGCQLGLAVVRRRGCGSFNLGACNLSELLFNACETRHVAGAQRQLLPACLADAGVQTCHYRRQANAPSRSRSRRVGDWRGPVGHGPFPVPARQTVRAVLPHTAYRRSSPAVFGLAAPVSEGSGRNDGPIEADQAHPVGRQEQLFEAPSPGSSPVALLGQPDREPLEGVVPDLAKDAGGVAVAESGRELARWRLVTVGPALIPGVPLGAQIR
jgi:hypothetical protein